ncbi:MAG TPA: DUF58 domain-containing protein [Gemmatimonadaceae bacterium]|nr:DUF58 domain-containing protein [Gemmatimonadaceae bacterium]
MARSKDGGREQSGARDSGASVPDFASLLDAVRGIRWPARAAVRGGIPGAHTSRMRGISAEFTEYRPYRQGDDLGRIDWKLFARSDRAYIRLSNDRAILPTTFVLDASASMAFPVESNAKWNLAAQLAIGLATVARNSADPVGLLIAREGQTVQLPPRTRQGVIHEMIRAVSENSPRGSEPLSPSLTAAMRVSGRIVIITDFLGDADDLLSNAARGVAAGREIHAVHVVAREEIDPPHETRLVADPEFPETRRPLTDDAREAYVAAYSSWRDRIAHDWSDAGVAYTAVVVGAEPPDQLIRRITAPRGVAATA